MSADLKVKSGARAQDAPGLGRVGIVADALDERFDEVVVVFVAEDVLYGFVLRGLRRPSVNARQKALRDFGLAQVLREE